jgi:lipoprotein-anchoring transpeptidase ErfK/SrfK
MATIAAMTIAVAVSGCGGGSHKPTTSRKATPSTGASAPGTTAPGPGTSLRAQVTVPEAHVYADPSAPTPAKTYPKTWLLNGAPDQPIDQVFLVDRRRADGWVQVLLPDRPNGSSGWIRSSELTLSLNPYRLQVSLAAHQIVVFERGQPIYTGPVATGTDATPTPTGPSYARVLLRSPNPTSVYGPFAYGLSAHSDVLQNFDGGDAEVGVHGNNDASVLGKSVTHGCVRMDNDEITQLSKILPLGTPIDIVS